mmetsp:Transcript_7554/g.34216  ORF Transcript_7554/g.34216 Transcript_7554/m.34216 type:complete len:237 (-) Transcript_7554:4811-5521(-)
MYRKARGLGPTRSCESTAAQLPLLSPSPIGPSRSTTERAASNVSDDKILLGSSALFPKLNRLFSSPCQDLTANPSAASTTAAPLLWCLKHFGGNSLNVAPERCLASCAGMSNSSVSATSASTSSRRSASQAASLIDSSVARRSTSEETMCGTAMDWLYADHPMSGSLIPTTSPNMPSRYVTPSTSAPRGVGMFVSGFGPRSSTPRPTRRTSAPRPRTAAAAANSGRPHGPSQSGWM